MAHKMLKSLLPTEDDVNAFQRLCNVQIEEMRTYGAHMKMVVKDPENYHPYPAPSAHPDIMAAIVADGDDYNIDFEIVDDVPAPTLEQKKRELSAQLIQLVSQRMEQIIPARKMNLMNLDVAKILSVTETDRTVEQNALVTSKLKFSAAAEQLNYYHAQMESKIEDLTADNVDGWKPDEMPEIVL